MVDGKCVVEWRCHVTDCRVYQGQQTSPKHTFCTRSTTLGVYRLHTGSDSWFAHARLYSMDMFIHANWLDSIVSSYQKKRDWSERESIVSCKTDIDDSHVQDSTALIHRSIQTRFNRFSYERRDKWQRELIVARLTFHRSDMFWTRWHFDSACLSGWEAEFVGLIKIIRLWWMGLNLYVAVKQAVQGSVTSWKCSTSSTSDQ